MRLIFGKHENTSYKFKLSIRGLLETSAETNGIIPKSVLLYQEVFEDHIWVQLTDFGHKPNTHFDPTEELDALEIPYLNFTGRYLVVQLQYIKCFKSFNDEEQSVPDILILPEVYGREIEPCNSIERIENLFKNIDDNPKRTSDNIKSGHSTMVEKTELNTKDVVVYKNFIENKNEDKKDSDKNIDLTKVDTEVISGLKELQINLAVSTLEFAKGQKEKREEITKLLGQIKNEQRKIYMCKSDDKHISESSLEYFVAISVEYARIIRSVMKDKTEKISTELEIPLINLAKVLFKAFVVNEHGEVRDELLKLLKEVIIPRLDDNEWICFVFDSISKFLSVPCPYYSQKAVIAALDYLSIPDGEILPFLIGKLQVPELNVSIKQLLKNIPKPIPGDVSKFSLMSSVLLLALMSLKKISLPEGNDVHKGVICNSCNNQNWITGVRYKCGNCSNYNVCSQEKCISHHLAEHPDHVFILIHQPLPYSPNLRDLAILQLKPLLPIFKYSAGDKKVHEGVDCDMCGKKNFEGIRYMCGNCDDYNLCDDCYNKNRDKHNPNHVFIKLNRDRKSVV